MKRVRGGGLREGERERGCTKLQDKRWVKDRKRERERVRSNNEKWVDMMWSWANEEVLVNSGVQGCLTLSHFFIVSCFSVSFLWLLFCAMDRNILNTNWVIRKKGTCLCHLVGYKKDNENVNQKWAFLSLCMCVWHICCLEDYIQEGVNYKVRL